MMRKGDVAREPFSDPTIGGRLASKFHRQNRPPKIKPITQTKKTPAFFTHGLATPAAKSRSPTGRPDRMKYNDPAQSQSRVGDAPDGLCLDSVA